MAGRRLFAVLSFVLAASPLCAETVSKKAETADVALVPGELKRDRAYTAYAMALIEIDLLSNVATADLPLTVSSTEPGLIIITGLAPSRRLQEFIMQNARRISGLMVRDNLKLSTVKRSPDGGVTPADLEISTRDTVASLFPESANRIRSSVADDFSVVLNGATTSYEAKRMISQAVKSQLGCRAVVNLLVVSNDAKTGTLAVSEDGQLRVKASLLPTVPVAPTDDPEFETEPTPKRKTGGVLADDVPDPDFADRQIREDVQKLLIQQRDIIDTKIDVEVEDHVVTLNGDLKTRKQVEAVIEAASEAPGVTKIVGRFKPFGYQRSLPRTLNKKDKAPEKTKLLGFIPWNSGGSDSGVDRRSRETIRKTLKTRMSKRADDISVRDSTQGGLIIEAHVKNKRDLMFLFKQLDNIVELRGVRYDAIIRVTED